MSLSSGYNERALCWETEAVESRAKKRKKLVWGGEFATDSEIWSTNHLDIP